MTGLRKLEEVDSIVLHCADTPNGLSRYKIEDIDEWHMQPPVSGRRSRSATKGGIWPHVGYHFVIHVDGTVEPGRGLDEIGAHVSGHNERTIGICMIGRDKFTAKQWDSQKNLVITLRAMFVHRLRVLGHRDLFRKYCPGYDVATWFYERGMIPTEDQICEERNK